MFGKIRNQIEKAKKNEVTRVFLMQTDAAYRSWVIEDEKITEAQKRAPNTEILRGDHPSFI